MNALDEITVTGAPAIVTALGMGTVFLVSDHGLHKKWPDSYGGWIRWVLAIALLTGWAVGVWFQVSPNVVALCTRFWPASS